MRSRAKGTLEGRVRNGGYGSSAQTARIKPEENGTNKNYVLYIVKVS
jgi:hypothetical protein